ncbi:hypothetical protein [Parabacteroides pacaensis]|uniref:hypothetical protein n=1 Tax=Parabacteroides pacaensis TaxID=2086575 RepID=UPI00131B8127|nr:hypothetical protein [Parabacteroides pacaensis]
MIHTIKFYVLLLMVSTLLPLLACNDEENEFSQPVIERSVEKASVEIGNETIKLGPQKEYEQDSEVVYKLSVVSSRNLSKFSVSSTSDAFSKVSRILKTIPADAIDEEGNFTKPVKNAQIYYTYHIHPLVPVKEKVTVTFTVQNDLNRAGTITHSFSTVKKGSTAGKLLNVIDMSYQTKSSRGIGTQMMMDWSTEVSGTRPLFGSVTNGGLFFSMKYRVDLPYALDAINQAGHIDLVGYFARVAGNDKIRKPALNLTVNQYYLASPGDSVVLMSAYAGTQAVAIQLTGNSGKFDISLAGTETTAEYAANINTTASNYVNKYKGVFSKLGFALSASGSKLVWKRNLPGVSIDPIWINPVSGNLSGGKVYDNAYVMKEEILREAIRAMKTRLDAEGKSLRVVYFKRLDNIDGPNRVTPEDFDLLSHDNELDTLLAGIEEENVTTIGPIALNQVYGFVMSDGKRGMIRTSPAQIELQGTMVTVSQPSASRNLWGIIKYQDPRE